MNGYLAEVIAEVRGWDDARPRSTQREIGWSGIYGCRAWIGHTLRGEWPSDDEDNWRANAGTALHEWLQAIRTAHFRRLGQAPLAEFEVPVSYRGIPGNVDEVLWGRGEITDYKFPSLKSARLWDDPQVQDERFTQPQGYAAALVGTPRWALNAPDPQAALVRVLVAPVDGTFADWRVYERPFDRGVADAAVERYAEVEAMVAGGGQPPKDKPVWFCSRFCGFYTLCRGGEKPDSGLPEISDPVLAAAVERYGQASENLRALYKVRDETRPLIEGLRGRARGFKVFQSRPGKDDWEPDMEQIRAWFSVNGLELPMRQRDGGKPRLFVVRDK